MPYYCKFYSPILENLQIEFQAQSDRFGHSASFLTGYRFKSHDLNSVQGLHCPFPGLIIVPSKGE